MIKQYFNEHGSVENSLRSPVMLRDPAGFWIRLAAKILDDIIYGIGLYILALLSRNILVQVLGQYHVEPPAFYMILIFYSIIYYTIPESSRMQASLGKYILKLKIINNGSGGKISFLRALVRDIGKIAPSWSVVGMKEVLINDDPILLLLLCVIIIIDYGMIFFNEKKRCLHDVIAGTCVVYR